MRLGLMLASLVVLSTGAAKADAPAIRNLGSRVLNGREATAEPYAAEITQAKATMMTEPENALAHARVAASLTDPSSLPGLTAAWLEGEALFRSRRADKALLILDAASQAADRLAPNSRLEGDILKARGQANGALGRVQYAMSDYQHAYQIFQKAKEPRSEAIALQLIAGVYQQAHDDEQALKYYQQSSEAFSSDPVLSLSLHNNRGVVLRDRGSFEEARAEFVAALKIADSLSSDNLRAQILTNLASTATLSGHYAQAKIAVQQGLAVSRRDNQAAGERPFLLGVAAKVSLATGDPSEASRLLDEVFKGVDLTSTPAEYRDIHDTAAQAYEAVGDTRKALAHHKALKRLDDLTRSLAASASAALVAARFDFTNQDLRISRLKEGQLQRDISLARSKERLRNFIILALASGGLVVSGGALTGFLYMRWSRNNIRAGRDQLAVANLHLEKALNAKTEFLAMASHEMRTPLNGILGITQVVLAKGGLEKVMRERISLVQSAGEAMKALVDDLLDVAKTENDSLAIENRPFALRGVIQGAQAFWQDKANAKGLKMTLDGEIPDDACGDQVRLKQIVDNLISNAIKFTDSGYVTLHASHDLGDFVFRVTDTGVGIRPEDQARIFEPFTQVECGTARRFAGTGLGLSICRKIARAMGGDVSVESRLSEGACFELRVPLQPSRSAASSGEAAATPAVLVLNPNPLTCGILKAALAPRFGEVACAKSLAEAVQGWKPTLFEIILADVAALGPEEERLAALMELASCWPAAQVTLLAPEPFRLSEAATSHGVDLLLKPVSVPAVVEHLGGRRRPSPLTHDRAA